MRGSKGKNGRSFNTINLPLQAISIADREVAEANRSRLFAGNRLTEPETETFVGHLNICGTSWG